MACILAEESRRASLTRCCWSTVFEVWALLLNRLNRTTVDVMKDGTFYGEERKEC